MEIKEKQGIEEKIKKRIIPFDQLPQHLEMRGKLEGWIKSNKEYSPSRIYVAPTLIEAGYEFGIPLSAEIQDCYLELKVKEIETEKGIYDIRVLEKYGRDLSVTGFDERDVIEKSKRVFLRYATKDFLEKIAEDQYYGKIIADLIFGKEKTDSFGSKWVNRSIHKKYIDLGFEKRKELIQEWPPGELKYHSFPSNDFKSSIIDKICHAQDGINAGSGTGLIWYYEPIKKNSGKNQEWVIFEMKDDKLITYPGKELQKEIEKEIETLKKYCQRRLL